MESTHDHSIHSKAAAPAANTGTDPYEASGLKFRAYFEPAWGTHAEPGIVIQVEDRPSAVYGYGWASLADIPDESLPWDADLWACEPIRKSMADAVNDLREKIRDAYERLVA